MNRSAVPGGKPGVEPGVELGRDTSSTAGVRRRRRWRASADAAGTTDRSRASWSLQTLLTMMIALAGLAVIVQQYLVSLHFERGHVRQGAVERAMDTSARLADTAYHRLVEHARAEGGERDRLGGELETVAELPAVAFALVVDGEDRVLEARDRRWRDRPIAGTPPGAVPAFVRAARVGGVPLLSEVEAAGLVVGVRPLDPDTSGRAVGRADRAAFVAVGIDTAESLREGRHRVLTIALTSAVLVLCVAGLFWYVIDRLLVRPLAGLLSPSAERGSAYATLRSRWGPPAELARIADAIDSLAALTRERERVRALEARLARIIEGSLNEVFVVDADSYRILVANRAARTNLGYDAGELARLHPWDLLEDRTEAEVVAQIASLRSGGSVQRVMEGRHRRKDGSTYPVRTHVQYMGEETPPVYVATCQDITEQLRRDEHIRLRDRAIEAVEVGILITEVAVGEHRIVYANRALCRMSGYAPEELLGRSPRLLEGERAAQPGIRRIRDARARGVSARTRFESVRRDGSPFMVRVTLSPVHDPAGKLTHHIGVHEDITRELATETRLQQTQRIDAVGQLSAGVAHDFNNLLDIIVGNLELLVPGASERERRERVDKARDAVERGGRLTRRLLAFARQGSLDPCVIDINAPVRDTLPLLRSSVGERVTLVTDLEPALGSTRVDPSEIENTVVNLVINAREAMPGGGRITIATADVHLAADEWPGLAAGDYVRLSVADEGCGMSEQVRSRAFEPFFTTKERGRGTGLGLASIHGFARQSGGEVTIESEPDRGTTVCVYLPRHADEQAGAAAAAGGGRATTSPLAGRVLVVEDNDGVREITLLRLRKLGMEPIEARDGVAAKRILASGEPIDLVLSDIVMAGSVSGYDLVRWIRERKLGHPVLLMSGFAGAEAVDETLGAERPRILAKPFTIEALRQAIAAALDRADAGAT